MADVRTQAETYLGDAVFASFDGYQIWLRTGDGNDQRIALEPAVLGAFMEYLRDMGMLPKPPSTTHDWDMMSDAADQRGPGQSDW